MYIVEDHAGLLESWASRSQPFDLASLPNIDYVSKGLEAHVVLFFVNCLKPSTCGSDFVADFTVLKPDGSEYGTYRGRRMWSGDPPPEDLFRLALPYVVFVAEPDDPVGPYHFRARISAAGTDNAIDLSRTVVVDEQQGSSPR